MSNSLVSKLNTIPMSPLVLVDYITKNSHKMANYSAFIFFISFVVIFLGYIFL